MQYITIYVRDLLVEWYVSIHIFCQTLFQMNAFCRALEIGLLEPHSTGGHHQTAKTLQEKPPSDSLLLGIEHLQRMLLYFLDDLNLP